MKLSMEAIINELRTIRRIRYMFYMVTKEMSFGVDYKVPPIIVHSIPMFFLLMIAELVIMKILRAIAKDPKTKAKYPMYQWNDFICALSL